MSLQISLPAKKQAMKSLQELPAKKPSKVGSIGSMTACGTRDPSSNTAQFFLLTGPEYNATHNGGPY